MASCRAGDCEVECGGGKGCGCIAESNSPMNCSCYCFGEGAGGTGGGTKFDPGSPVDVSINDLPIFEAAALLSEPCTERVLFPMGKGSEHVSVHVQGKRLGGVLHQLGLTTQESLERGQRRTGIIMLLVGLLIGALVSRAALSQQDP